MKNLCNTASLDEEKTMPLIESLGRVYDDKGWGYTQAQWGLERLFFQTSVATVIGFFGRNGHWAGYLAVAGRNLLAQISVRISPFGV